MWERQHADSGIAQKIICKHYNIVLESSGNKLIWYDDHLLSSDDISVVYLSSIWIIIIIH